MPAFYRVSKTASGQSIPGFRPAVVCEAVNITRTLFLLVLTCGALLPAQPPRDPRHIENGFEIPDENYAGQPYVVTAGDGKWLCVMTTGPGKEGAPGQHVVSPRSADHGRTWTPPTDIEPGSAARFPCAATGSLNP